MTLPIDVRILGEEYRDKEFTGKEICDKRGIECHFNRRDHYFSSSDLRQRVYDAELRKQENLRDSIWPQEKAGTSVSNVVPSLK